MSDLSLFELIVWASLAFAALLGVIALVDVLRRPAWQWNQAGKNKPLWVGLLLVGILFGAFGGLALAVVYYFFTQPALKRATPGIRAPSFSS